MWCLAGADWTARARVRNFSAFLVGDKVLREREARLHGEVVNYKWYKERKVDEIRQAAQVRGEETNEARGFEVEHGRVMPSCIALRHAHDHNREKPRWTHNYQHT